MYRVTDPPPQEDVGPILGEPGTLPGRRRSGTPRPSSGRRRGRGTSSSTSFPGTVRSGYVTPSPRFGPPLVKDPETCEGSFGPVWSRVYQGRGPTVSVRTGHRRHVRSPRQQCVVPTHPNLIWMSQVPVGTTGDPSGVTLGGPSPPVALVHPTTGGVSVGDSGTGPLPVRNPDLSPPSPSTGPRRRTDTFTLVQGVVRVSPVPGKPTGPPSRERIMDDTCKTSDRVGVLKSHDVKSCRKGKGRHLLIRLVSLVPGRSCYYECIKPQTL